MGAVPTVYDGIVKTLLSFENDAPTSLSDIPAWMAFLRRMDNVNEKIKMMIGMRRPSKKPPPPRL